MKKNQERIDAARSMRLLGLSYADTGKILGVGSCRARAMALDGGPLPEETRRRAYQTGARKRWSDPGYRAKNTGKP